MSDATGGTSNTKTCTAVMRAASTQKRTFSVGENHSTNSTIAAIEPGPKFGGSYLFYIRLQLIQLYSPGWVIQL